MCVSTSTSCVKRQLLDTYTNYRQNIGHAILHRADKGSIYKGPVINYGRGRLHNVVCVCRWGEGGKVLAMLKEGGGGTTSFDIVLSRDT